MDSELFPSMSRARKACRRGLVLVNDAEGRCLTTASAGDTISLQTRVAPGFTPRGRAPFDVRVLYTDVLELMPGRDLELGATAVDLATLLAQSDVVSMHVPLDSVTQAMASDEFFGRMKDSAIFINTCRGEPNAGIAFVRYCPE